MPLVGTALRNPNVHNRIHRVSCLDPMASDLCLGDARFEHAGPVSPGKCQDSTKARPFTSVTVAIHYSLTIPPSFDAVQSDLPAPSSHSSVTLSEGTYFSVSSPPALYPGPFLYTSYWDPPVHLVSRLRMRGALPTCFHYILVAWYLITETAFTFAVCV
jgi:hypothetical protein